MKNLYANNHYKLTTTPDDVSEAIAFQDVIINESTYTERPNPAPRSKRPLGTYTFRDFEIKQLTSGIQPTFALTYLPTGEVLNDDTTPWYICTTFVWWFYNRHN